jgi:allantoinase
MPNGNKLAVMLCNNNEYFAFRSGLGSDGTIDAVPQTQRNGAWREHRNWVGNWNNLDLLRTGILALHNVNL